jgi:ferrous iron transport protein B
VEEAYNAPPDEVITEERYKAVAKLVSKVLAKPKGGKRGFQDLLDDLLLRPYVGIPFFFVVMFLVFKFSFEVSAPLMDWLDGFVEGFIGKYSVILLQSLNAPPWLISFVKDAIIGGIGFFLTFIPILVFMYIAIGFLEHSGYFARAAFVTDRFARWFGITGKSTVALILGFGCNVPAVLATRTLENPYLRRLTALMVPFMSCSARLPVYALLSLAFFPGHPAVAIFSMYLLGVAVALLVAFILSRTVYRKQLLELPFIVEIPPYRLPNFKELIRSMWTPVWEFIHRAGTVIFVANIAVWILMNIPYGAPPKDTLLGRFSTTVQPIFKPLGFGEHWENVAVLVPGFLAKEIVITSYGTILGVQEGKKTVEKANFWNDLERETVALVKAVFNSVKALFVGLLPSGGEEQPQPSLVKRIKRLFNPASALAFMVFVLLYTPCAATVAAMWQEFGARFALTSIVLNFITAYILSLLTYRIALVFLS